MHRNVCKYRPVLKLLPRFYLTEFRKNGQRFCSSQGEDDSERKLAREVLRSVKLANPKRNTYPKFLDNQKQKSELGDLLQELRTSKNIAKKHEEVEEHVLSQPPAEVKNNFKEKISPHVRVDALYKHADISIVLVNKTNTITANKESLGNQQSNIVSSAESNKEASQIGNEKSIQNKIKDIKPDESEVGSLLKALMQNKLEDDQVTDIIANVKPGPSFVGRISENVHSAMRGGGMVSRAKKEEMKKQDFRSTRGSPQQDYITQRKKRQKGGGNLFVGPKTNYFDDLFKISAIEERPRFLSRHELEWQEMLKSLVQKQGPSNGFEELMLQEDKMWSFPIDNEVGLDIENDSSFEDHVFLDHHLDLFPETGHLRRFMELVITGLQQNAYMTAQQKVETVYWFKDYFDKFTESDLEL